MCQVVCKNRRYQLHGINDAEFSRMKDGEADGNASKNVDIDDGSSIRRVPIAELELYISQNVINPIGARK